MTYRNQIHSTKATPTPRFPDVVDQFTMRSEQDLDFLLRAHPRLAAMPDTDKKIRKALRSKPVELECGADEVLCLVDSGSKINVAWIGKHIPQYVDLADPASERGDFATTSGGHKFFNKGRCLIKGYVREQSFPVAFKDMEVELPILSVRKIVKKKNDVRFTQKGGTIRNQVTGRRSSSMSTTEYTSSSSRYQVPTTTLVSWVLSGLGHHEPGL